MLYCLEIGVISFLNQPEIAVICKLKNLPSLVCFCKKRHKINETLSNITPFKTIYFDVKECRARLPMLISGFTQLVGGTDRIGDLIRSDIHRQFAQIPIYIKL